MLRYFHHHGLLERHVTDDMLTWRASGGFSIDASVHIAGASMSIIAFITDPAPVRSILSYLDLPTRPVGGESLVCCEIADLSQFGKSRRRCGIGYVSRGGAPFPR